LYEQLVLPSLSNDDIEEMLKSNKLKQLLTFEISDYFQITKPELPVILMSAELSEPVGPQSWLLLTVVAIPERFKSDKVRGEAIHLIQDFVGGYKSENMKQNLKLVARDNRKKHKK
jgi:hypothetical protein